MAGLYWQVHDYDEALKLFFEALEIEQKRNNSKGIAFIYSNIGRIYFYKSMQKNGSTFKTDNNLEIDSYVEKAIASFEKALSLDPRHVPTLNSYANACVEWGEEEKAKVLFEKILSIDPQHKGARPNI